MLEETRQELETRNERVINAVRALFLLGGFVLHGANLVLELAPFKSTLGLVTTLAIALIGCGLLQLYLSQSPPYWAGRKYLLAAIEVGVVWVAAGFMVTQLPGNQGLVNPLLFYNLTIVLAGLRYSYAAVLTVGILASFAQLTMVRTYALPNYVNNLSVLSLASLALTSLAVGLLVSSLLGLLTESIQKARLSRFLAPELIEEIERNPGLLEGEVQEKTATVLFADIRGFTPLSERLTPAQVVTILNRFLETMTEPIMDEGGMLDKYIGDAIMAVFGAPLAQDDHADRAVRAAQAMSNKLLALNRELAEEGLPGLSFGVGIHTGPLVLGAVGSQWRRDYTVVGDTVNLCARIEALTRLLEADILLSQETVDCLQGDFPLAPLAIEKVKGRETPVEVYGVSSGRGAQQTPKTP